jgi:hypothetical protein
LSATFSFQDKEFARTVLHVLIEEEPVDDGLGIFKAMRYAAPFIAGFWLFAGIGAYLFFRK